MTKSSLLQKHTKKLSKFQIDPNQVGELLAKGKQHYVYSYQKTQVLKIPRSSYYNKLYGKIDVSVIKSDLDLLNRYCSRFVPKTRVLTQGDDYLLIQDRLAKPAFVSYSNLSKIKAELEILVAAGKKLYQQEKLFLDLFGYQGMTQSLVALLQMNKTRVIMTNVLIDFSTKSPRLYLVDTNLSSLPQKNHPANLFHKVIDLLTIGITHVLTYWAFGIKF